MNNSVSDLEVIFSNCLPATFHNQVCTEYEKNVFSEYHNNTSGKNIFTSPANEKIGENVDKIKLASTQPSLEYLYEWIKLESREIEVDLIIL